MDAVATTFRTKLHRLVEICSNDRHLSNAASHLGLTVNNPTRCNPIRCKPSLESAACIHFNIHSRPNVLVANKGTIWPASRI